MVIPYREFVLAKSRCAHVPGLRDEKQSTSGWQPSCASEGMQRRLDIQNTAPAVLQAMFALEAYARRTWHSEPLLLGLVKMRASQLNGCAYCIDMHSKDARVHGETEQRLYALSAWEETPFFSDRERAALAWTEAITLISSQRAPDHIY